MKCDKCGATLRETNRIGVCTRNPACNSERSRRVRRQQRQGDTQLMALAAKTIEKLVALNR